MPPQSPGIAVIQVRDRLAESRLQPGPDIKPAPRRMDKVRGAPRAQNTAGTGGAGSIQTDHRNLAQVDTSPLRCDSQTVFNLLQTDIRTFPRQSRVLTQPFQQKAFSAGIISTGKKRVIDGSAAEINARNDFHSPRVTGWPGPVTQFSESSKTRC